MTTPPTASDAVERRLAEMFLPVNKPDELGAWENEIRELVALAQATRAEPGEAEVERAVENAILRQMDDAGGAYRCDAGLYAKAVVAALRAMQSAIPGDVVEAATKVLEWWPEGSERGSAAERAGSGWADDLANLRSALNRLKE